MSLHAIDDIGDAIDATKSFLLPFAARTWVKLAVVVFFIGGGGGGFNGLQNAGNIGGQDQPPGGGGFDQPAFDGSVPPVDALPTEVLVILAAVGVLVLVGLLAGLLSNFMEFVFVQSLVEREVHIRRYLRGNLGNGLRLLVFRLALSLVSLLLAVGFLYAIFVTAFGGSLDNITVEALFGVLPLAVLFFVALALVQGLLTGFTNVFVVPMMLTTDRGVLGSWRRLLSSMTSNPKQYLAYLAFSIVLAIGVGIIGSILIFIAIFLLGIPFVLIAACTWFVLHGSTLGLAILVITGLVFGLLLLLITNLIQVPLQAFLRYYAMLVLGDTDEELDPIPEVRGDIRSGDSVDGSASESV